MFRYPDGTFRTNPPAKVEYDGFHRKFSDLTREQWDELGYNECVYAVREPYTDYVTHWEKDESYMMVEIIDEETYNQDKANVARVKEIDAELLALDKAAVRDTEDLADLLISKGVFTEDELLSYSKARKDQRNALRDERQVLSNVLEEV